MTWTVKHKPVMSAHVVTDASSGAHIATVYVSAHASKIGATPEMLEALEAAAAYVELFTGNGVRKQPPAWAVKPNGDFDADAIAARARDVIAQATQ